ncbi:B-cadherin-like [Salvelinus namaycush]|uniref:B-cadherin-like n=2 Tax=Salvelinus TaxID=8033 RepID=A0A8U0PIY4_SALNM|nr:B-cadherin-like [Salvelinus namaycush]
MAELQKSLQPSPAQSVQYSRSRAIHQHHHPHTQHQQPQDTLSRLGASTAPSSFTTTLRRDVPPTRTPAQGQSRPLLLARKSLSFSSQDLARYLCEIIRDADQAPESAPFDSLQVFSTEGGGSLAGSLSSFSSAGLEEDTARGQDSLKDWGPRFEKVKALYEKTEASDL